MSRYQTHLQAFWQIQFVFAHRTNVKINHFALTYPHFDIRFLADKNKTKIVIVIMIISVRSIKLEKKLHFSFRERDIACFVERSSSEQK